MKYRVNKLDSSKLQEICAINQYKTQNVECPTTGSSSHDMRAAREQALR
jgi:hypothetical protein